MRDRAAMFDLTAFCVFDVVGPGALECVQTRLDAPDGRQPSAASSTRRCSTPGGGFRSDLTVMRLGDDHFRVVTGGAHGMADLKWYRDHLPADGTAQIVDLTSSWCTLGLWGPRAATSSRSTTSDDVSHEAFPFANCRTIEMGSLRVLASRISYVGDLGWELYVPIEQGAKLWDMVAEAGAPHGIVPAGIGVYATTGRLEKCYRAFGYELDGEYDVVEAGMAWGQVKEQDFVGKEAHVRQRESEPAARALHAHRRRPHGERRRASATCSAASRSSRATARRSTDAKGRRSFVTSAGAGPSVGKHILMSYLPPEHARRASSSRSSTWASASRSPSRSPARRRSSIPTTSASGPPSRC